MERFRSYFINTFLVYSRYLVVTIFALVLYSPVNAADCPDISGAWQRPGDSMVVNYEQDGCKVVSTNAATGGFDHKVKARWSSRDERFNYVVVRKNIKNGCVTEMYGYITVITDDRYKSTVYGTDGRCELPLGFTEESVWERK